jgi:hypothetical protein
MLRLIFVVTLYFLVSCTSTPENQIPSDSGQQTIENGAGSDLDSAPVSAETDVLPDAPSDDRIRDAQQRLRDRDRAEAPESSDEPTRYRLDVAPFNHFNDAAGYFNIIGASLQEVQRVLGEPIAMVRQGRDSSPVRREVRVYHPYEEDSTGLYLYILNGTVESFRLDTFLGLANSDIMEYFR